MRKLLGTSLVAVGVLVCATSASNAQLKTAQTLQPGAGAPKPVAISPLVPLAKWTPALKAELAKRIKADLGAATVEPPQAGPIRVTPSSPRAAGTRVLGFELAQTTPDAFSWRVPPGTAAPTRFVEIRMTGLRAGANYLVDCTFTHRASQRNRLANVPIPTFTIARNGAVASEDPAGGSLNDATFHFVTGLRAVAGENLLALSSRSSHDGTNLDWRSEWNACQIEPLR
jgi:hypothetical protein